MDTLLSLSNTLLGGQTASVAAAVRTAAATTAQGDLAGDTATFSEQALALARTLVAASNAAVASNAGMTATAAVASNAGTAATGNSLGLGTHGHRLAREHRPSGDVFYGLVSGLRRGTGAGSGPCLSAGRAVPAVGRLFF